ncbi:MAG: MurT ligase domain-containing protein [Clostridia bacterium]|nr:MurT ligase domain-containing protein [Clostridia bacterium]
MRVFFVILVCKLLHFIGKLIGKGSSLPGKYALKLDRNILKKIKMPEYIIAVTGSNGKTSTVEMIAHILQSGGKTVAYNKEGSNQIEGVTTFILCNSTMRGKVKSDILLIESDERFAQYTFKYFQPTHYVITNLYRDQLTRNGHPEWVYDCLKNSIYDNTQLILNADDPLVSCFGYGRENVVYFGADKLSVSHEKNNSAYNDGIFCPNCKHRLSYEYYHYNHIGKYNCPFCGLKRNDTQFTVTSADLDKGEITINGNSKITLALKSLYNVYNILAAYSVCTIAGIKEETICKSINNYVLKNGRVIEFSLGNRHGTLITSKHENSVSYDQSLRLAADDKNGCDVLIIVDAISRKYFTSDVSWLWDIDFELLASENVGEIVLAGLYSADLKTRFEFTGIDENKIKEYSSITEAAEYLKTNSDRKLYVITCFSDKGKFLGLVREEKQ